MPDSSQTITPEKDVMITTQNNNPGSDTDTESLKEYGHTLWWVFGIILILFCTLFIASQTFLEDAKWLSGAIGILGCIVSTGGVIFALYQIKQGNFQISQAKTQIDQANIKIKQGNDEINRVAEVTRKIQTAVNENREEIKNFLSFSDMGHLIEVIKNTQKYIRSKDYNSAVILMQEVKDDMIRAHLEFEKLLSDSQLDVLQIIKNINIDISNLVVTGINKSEKTDPKNAVVHPQVIHDHLEEAREVIIKIESSIKQKKL